MLTAAKYEEYLGLPDADFRKSLVRSLFYKGVLSVTVSLSSKLQSGAELLVRPPTSSGQQIFDSDQDQYPLSQPVPKLDSVKQVRFKSALFKA